jgi:formylglycine-generating enzyme required for sulfatase activity
MGSDTGLPDETPPHTATLSGFWMDKNEVTNRQFAMFVSETGYVTVAERVPLAKDLPGVAKEDLVPGALVFEKGSGWSYVPGANWRHPEGPRSSIKGRLDHPVVQVCWEDAVAYAKWAGKSLPTEAQFEYAARGGNPKARYAWGLDEMNPKHPQANCWQGDFPTANDNTDGFLTTAPVRSFTPNGFGLYDMAGNVWEWCQDWYRADAYRNAIERDPTGPASSNDPDEPGVVKRVIRGGSFLCADCYCKGYRLTARMKTSPDTGLCHTGFRCVLNKR